MFVCYYVHHVLGLVLSTGLIKAAGNPKMLRRPHNKEGPPVFSHEFVIQNHADIISCVCMVVFMGLIPQVSPVRLVRL